MTYPEVVNWLFQQVPNYQNQGGTAYKPGLDQIRNLLGKIGNPHQRIKTIHIAGTNGKGSVSHILAAIFQNQGYKTGLFTSPHITDFRERIRINGALIDEAFVCDFIQGNKVHFETDQPSFFEITTAMAFKAFDVNNCEIAIIETGLGGRLDSTNVLKPELAVITNIGIDHIAFLGDTLEEIAGEKAGIIKAGVPVVIGDMDKTLIPLFENKARELNAEIILSQNSAAPVYESDLLGSFQQRNIHTAVTAINQLNEEWNLSDDLVRESLKKVTTLTNFQGRLQQISNQPKVILDAAHNLEGIKNLLEEISKFEFKNLRIVYGASNDKNWKGILKELPVSGIYYFTEFDSKRSVKFTEFSEMAKTTALNYTVFNAVDTALNKCKSDADSNDLILVCGSFYLMEKIN